VAGERLGSARWPWRQDQNAPGDYWGRPGRADKLDSSSPVLQAVYSGLPVVRLGRDNMEGVVPLDQHALNSRYFTGSVAL
jgi:hypothetical protein